VKFISTRGTAPALSFDDVLLSGLASDGGLYVPEVWPTLPEGSLKSFKNMRYEEAAFKIMRPFCAGVIADEDLFHIIETAYSTFSSDSPAPLRDLGDGLWLMELYHGPTLAFKDVAMQFLGGMFDYILSKRGEQVTIIGATSGDTGSAAIEAVRGKDAIDIFMLHPKGRVSEVQRRQMSTVLDDNIHNIALEGTFDDCQSMVKAMFNDTAFRARHPLSAVNSINWARIMAQIVYYITSAAQLGAPENPVSFCVPTGNFGNVFAGYAAKQMGVPVNQFLVASNSNDILTRFFNSGVMEMQGVEATTSPSMDIQISSNFERLLFELSGRDGERVAGLMNEFVETGRYEIGKDELDEALSLFSGARYDDDQVKAEIHRHYVTHHNETGNLIDPHTAVAMAAAREHRQDTSTPMVVLSTAHPAKFGDTVKSATGVSPELPEHLADLFEREERYETLPNEIRDVEAYIDTMTNKHSDVA
jgi:threonine synthase